MRSIVYLPIVIKLNNQIKHRGQAGNNYDDLVTSSYVEKFTKLYFLYSYDPDSESRLVMQILVVDWL